MAASHGWPKIAGSHLMLGKMCQQSPSELPKGTGFTDILVLDFWLPKLREEKLTLLEASQCAVHCNGYPVKQTQLVSTWEEEQSGRTRETNLDLLVQNNL